MVVSDLISRKALMEGRVENDPVRIAAQCAPDVKDAVVPKHCKDCRHYSHTSGYCMHFIEIMPPEGYCSEGGA